MNRRTVRALVVVLGTIGLLSTGSGVASAEPAAQSQSRASEPGCVWFWWIDRWICRDVDDPHRRARRTLAMETNRTVAERRLATLNEVSALDARRTHHRLVELLTTAMVVMRDARKAVRGSRADAAGGAISPCAVGHPARGQMA